jgi:hypothetical protein
MGRRALGSLWLTLAVGGWLNLYWLMHVSAPEHHGASMAGHWFDAMPLCAGCLLMLALLVLLVLARPVLVLGSELWLRLVAGRALRPRLAPWTGLPLGCLAPKFDRPPILASGHGERAPPLAPAPT